MESARGIVIYDGACGVCQALREWAERKDRHRRLTFIPYQAPELERLVPGLPPEVARQALHFVREDGRRFRGAHAAFEVMKRWPGGWGRLGHVLALPPLRWLAEPVYRLFARHRTRVSRWLGLEACAHYPPEE